MKRGAKITAELKQNWPRSQRPQSSPTPDIDLHGSHTLGQVHCSGLHFPLGESWDNICPDCLMGWFLKTKQIDNLHKNILIKLHINAGTTRKNKRLKETYITR